MSLSATSSVFIYLRLYLFHFNFRQRTLLDTGFFIFFTSSTLSCSTASLHLYNFWWEVGCYFIGVPNKRIVVSLDTFKIFSLSLAFSILTVCLGVYLLVFILLGFHWGSWICRLMLKNSGKFTAFISSNILFCFSLPSPFGTHIMNIMVFHISLKLLVFLHSFFSVLWIAQSVFKFANFFSFVSFKSTVLSL